MGDANKQQFLDIVWGYYQQHGRHDLPWRIPEPGGSFDPYKILVSELMLQQTGVQRVIPKYHSFLAQFPDVKTLASARLGDVLITWSGLGYNRRAKFLWQAAQKIHSERGSNFPTAISDLVMLPGVGKNTAGAIVAYAYDQPAVFIETNIRTVFIHHFFRTDTSVPDALITNLVQATLPAENVRGWYWAVMDYGSYLKQTVGNTARASKSYAKQAPFDGSRRQIRGQVLRLLADGEVTEKRLLAALPDVRTPAVLADLVREQMICQSGAVYHLA